MGVEEGMKCSHSSLPLINHELSLKTLQIEPLSHCNFESIIFFFKEIRGPLHKCFPSWKTHLARPIHQWTQPRYCVQVAQEPKILARRPYQTRLTASFSKP